MADLFMSRIHRNFVSLMKLPCRFASVPLQFDRSTRWVAIARCLWWCSRSLKPSTLFWSK